MAMPDTRHAMRRAGYKLISTSACKACAAPIEWWQTTNGKKMPFDVDSNEDAAAVTHFGTCLNSKDFSGQGQAAAKAPAAQTPAPGSRARLEQELCQMVDRTRARAIVLIDDHGDVLAYRLGLDAEQVRSDVISAANHLRSAIKGARHAS